MAGARRSTRFAHEDVTTSPTRGTRRRTRGIMHEEGQSDKENTPPKHSNTLQAEGMIGVVGICVVDIEEPIL